MLQGDGIHSSVLKVLAAQHMDETANKFFKCYQVNPEMKQDGVKEALEMSENSVGLRNNTLRPLLSNPRDNDKTNLTFKVANEQARQNL